MRWATWRGVAKLAIGLVWVPVAAELFLRLLAPVPLLPRYVVAAPYGVRANQPGVVYYHTTPDVHVRMAINSKGVRSDREIPYAKPAGVRRIVGLGDSFGMGYEVDLEDMFLSVMEQRLNAAGQRCEVVNLSVSGHGNAEELIALREEGFKYGPDLVVVAWHETDLDDNMRSQLFRLEGGELVRGATAYLPGTATQEKLAKYGLYRWLSENCQLYSFARESVAEKLKKLLAQLRSGPAEAPAEGEVPTAVAADPAALSPKQELAVALLRRIQADCAERGAKLLILDLPVPGEGEYVRSFPRDPEGKDFGLQVVSPAAAFTRHRNELLFWQRGHFHLTPLGCRLVGEALAGAILDESLLEGPAVAG